MSGGVRVQDARCRGCANCIKSCPTEALRVIEGLVRIIPELCIDCGECVRVCREKAIQLYEDEWHVLRAQKNLVLMADPTFYVQVGAYARPALMKEALQSSGIEDLTEYEATAYDMAAYAIAKLLDTENRDRLPFISTYCPAVLRLIQINFPELIGRIVPVESPLEIGVALWRLKTGAGRPRHHGGSLSCEDDAGPCAGGTGSKHDDVFHLRSQTGSRHSRRKPEGRRSLADAAEPPMAALVCLRRGEPSRRILFRASADDHFGVRFAQHEGFAHGTGAGTSCRGGLY